MGVLANGEEEGKGNDLVKSAGPMMRDQLKNFVGNVEAKEFFAGKVDVLVTDGFTGNIMLKASESVAKLLLETLKAELLSSLRTKIGALLAKPAFNKVRKLLDPNEVGAAPLLGIDGLLFIGHGRSDASCVERNHGNKKAIEKTFGTFKDTFSKDRRIERMKLVINQRYINSRKDCPSCHAEAWVSWRLASCTLTRYKQCPLLSYRPDSGFVLSR